MKPENVISLSLADKLPDQVELFLSIVHIGQFTQLRSLECFGIDKSYFNLILKRINVNLIDSLNVTIRNGSCDNDDELEETRKLFASFISQSKLRKLELNIFCKIACPTNYSIQHFTINRFITLKDLCTLLQSMPQLKTLILKDGFRNNPVVSSPSIIFKQITSLSIEHHDLDIDSIEAFLSLTPSLVHLKLISSNSNILLNGKRFEEFIKNNLPQLDRLEFFFSKRKLNNFTKEEIEEIIAPFRTSFWIENKKWFVNLERDKCTTLNNTVYFALDSSSIDLYTIPICKSSFQLTWPYTNVLLTTCPMKNTLDSTMMDHVDTVHLILQENMTIEVGQQVCNHLKDFCSTDEK
jgi:hypothetical protein